MDEDERKASPQTAYRLYSESFRNAQWTEKRRDSFKTAHVIDCLSMRMETTRNDERLPKK